ncbi:riboflavin transporter Mch5p [[Candida] jaroonii]|uniref:Riboflavin transporter Mch5p n=1 Tax=[Candida] jaroonii TaxID=467808 RepID=A0ACA9YCP5_9ASCO|nr:riboflavin transporter Mch5p [[Candida] jaroonii]
MPEKDQVKDIEIGIDERSISSRNMVRDDSEEILESSEKDSEELTYPDGGLQAILVLIGCSAVVSGTLGLSSASGTIENYISVNLLPDESSSNVSWIFAVFNFTAFALILFVGPVFNQIGCRIMLIGSLGFVSVGMMCFSLCHELYQFILCHFVTGFGVCLGFTCSINVVTHWFNKWRSTAVGISFVGSSIGGIVYPIILNSLFTSVGFGWGIRVLGFICMVLISIGIVLTKDRRYELGFMKGDKGNPIMDGLKQIDFGILKDPIFATLVIGCIGNSGPFFLTLNYIVSYATAHGWSTSDAYSLTIAMNACSIGGRLSGGYLADKYGRFNWFIVTNLIATIGVFLFWLPPWGSHKGGLFTYACLFGYTSGSYFQSSPTCVAQISKVDQFAVRYGTSSFIISVINFALLPIGGAIIGNKAASGFDHMVIFVAVFQILGLVFVALCRFLYGGWNLKRL